MNCIFVYYLSQKCVGMARIARQWCSRYLDLVLIYQITALVLRLTIDTSVDIFNRGQW